MALTPTTLQSLITLLRQRTNMEVSQFVTNSELTSYLNSSLSRLDDILVTKFNDYKLTSVLFNIAPNTNTFTIPLDFLKMRGLDVWYDLSTPDGYRTIHAHDFGERNRKAYPGNAILMGPSQMTYRLQGQTVLILPALIAPNWTYRFWYTPQYIPLVGLGDTLQTYMDGQAWTEYAIVDSAVKVLEKQDLDPAIFLAQSQSLQEHIIRLATPNRDSGEPAAVSDTSRQHLTGGWGGYGWDW